MPHLHPEVKSLIDQIFFKMVKKVGKKQNKVKTELKIGFNNRSRFTQKGWEPSPPDTQVEEQLTWLLHLIH